MNFAFAKAKLINIISNSIVDKYQQLSRRYKSLKSSSFKLY
ncbi:hypothetical protein JCM19298_2247 [Nonlabens ulvanivorans]|nr:hypothetical protein JCM19297_3607 [Nonlabens ulvanivorans]GAK93528.1 hypothetical protein JCM19298_2247 [Nonlabens ulvanivorans]